MPAAQQIANPKKFPLYTPREHHNLKRLLAVLGSRRFFRGMSHG